MINFFRNTRKQLAGENKFGKYLRYAFGEILLVVIGILIALQVNNWNGKRKQEQNFNTILEQIYDALYETNPQFNLNDILEFENKHPEVKALNEKYNGVNWYRNHLNQLKTIKPEQTKVIK